MAKSAAQLLYGPVLVLLAKVSYVSPGNSQTVVWTMQFRCDDSNVCLLSVFIKHLPNLYYLRRHVAIAMLIAKEFAIREDTQKNSAQIGSLSQSPLSPPSP